MFRKKTIPPTVQELWEKHKPEFLKIHSKETIKPLTHLQLVKDFVDINGKQIYKFTKDVGLPIERLGKKQEYLEFMTTGNSAEQHKMFDDTLARIILDGTDLIDVKKRCAAVFAEKELRRKIILHTELLYNFIAVQLVREDENPEYFDNDIHLDKVKTFKEMTKNGGSYFFFQKEELKLLSSFYNMSQEEWEKYFQESAISQTNLPHLLKAYESLTTLTRQERTSTNN